MTADHERIEELLAGYALRALSDEDERAAERLLADHVPSCQICRESLHAYLEVGGDLAMAPTPAAPPDLLLARLRRSAAAPPAPRRRRPVAWSIAVAAAAAVAGLVAWNTVALENRVSREGRRTHAVIDAMTVLSDKQAQTVDLVRRPAPRPFTRLLAAYVPGRQEMSIIGRGVPDPSGGHVYRVWLVSPGRYQLVGSFRPEDGLVALSFYVDLTAYSGLLVSEEQGPPQSQPAGKTKWATRL